MLLRPSRGVCPREAYAAPGPLSCRVDLSLGGGGGRCRRRTGSGAAICRGSARSGRDEPAGRRVGCGPRGARARVERASPPGGSPRTAAPGGGRRRGAGAPGGGSFGLTGSCRGHAAARNPHALDRTGPSRRGHVAPGITLALTLPADPAPAAEPLPGVAEVGPPIWFPTSPRRPSPLVPLYVSFAALQVADVASTVRALDSGGQEANPIVGSFADSSAAMLAVKAGATAGTIYLTERLWKKNRPAANRPDGRPQRRVRRHRRPQLPTIRTALNWYHSRCGLEHDDLQEHGPRLPHPRAGPVAPGVRPRDAAYSPITITTTSRASSAPRHPPSGPRYAAGRPPETSRLHCPLPSAVAARPGLSERAGATEGARGSSGSRLTSSLPALAPRSLSPRPSRACRRSLSTPGRPGARRPRKKNDERGKGGWHAGGRGQGGAGARLRVERERREPSRVAILTQLCVSGVASRCDIGDRGVTWRAGSADDGAVCGPPPHVSLRRNP